MGSQVIQMLFGWFPTRISKKTGQRTNWWDYFRVNNVRKVFFFISSSVVVFVLKVWEIPILVLFVLLQ